MPFQWYYTNNPECEIAEQTEDTGATVTGFEHFEDISAQELRNHVEEHTLIASLEANAEELLSKNAWKTVTECSAEEDETEQIWVGLVGYRHKEWLSEEDGHAVGKRAWRVKLPMKPETSWGATFLYLDSNTEVEAGTCGIRSSVYKVNL